MTTTSIGTQALASGHDPVTSRWLLLAAPLLGLLYVVALPVVALATVGHALVRRPVSYTHLTLPTKRIV